MNAQRLLVASSLFLIAAGQRGEASQLYNATTLTQQNLASRQPQLYSFDNQGRVLGWNLNDPRGQATFLYDPQAGGKVTTLAIGTQTPPPPGTFFPQAMNNSGQMIGYRDVQAVLASGGSYTDMPGYPRAINDRGDVAGWAHMQNGQMVMDGSGWVYSQQQALPVHSYIESNGVFKDLGTLPGYTNLGVAGLNNNGQAAVTASASGGHEVHAAFYDGQSLKDLGTLGGDVSGAIGLNNRGDVIGWSLTGNDQAGFVVYNGGTMINIGHLPGDTWANPAGINDAGEIVGTSYGGGTHGFIYDNGVMTDLSKLVTSSNIHVTAALAINSADQILAQGYLDGEDWIRTFLLTPDGQAIPASPDPLIEIVPEPSTWAIFGLAAVVLVLRRR